MIPTRIHGAVDYAVAAGLGGLSASAALTPEVRRVLGAAGAAHAGYSALTDYEAGVAPVLGMRQHLALDALGGAALLAAGLLMRRQPREQRALLAGIGLAELAVVALSADRPRSGPGQGAGPVSRLLDSGRAADAAPSAANYPPLDQPKPVAEDVWVVDSPMTGAMGAALAVRMTVLRLPDGGLLLHSPVRYGVELKRALEAIGPIRFLVAPNSVHWLFLRDWQRACPDALTWGAPGLRDRTQVRRAGVRVNRDLVPGAPEEWGGAVSVDIVPGGLGFREATLFHRPSRTLLLTDLVVNLEPHKLPAIMRPLLRLLGMVAPGGMAPLQLRLVLNLRRDDVARAALRLLRLEPERVIFAHGRWFERNATSSLRRSLRWLLG